jgi:hypothetical protein
MEVRSDLDSIGTARAMLRSLPLAIAAVGHDRFTSVRAPLTAFFIKVMSDFIF